ncbi:MAG: type II toxin-antitoxin system RelE/ParE family toxin [Aestuariivirgaceae bacterium]|nr:type II toxin-antitoxin system RelE/ParE family toxin [Aestuariivirgaceae bacterium]
MKVRFSQRALLDVRESGDFIAAENPSAATRFVESLEARCNNLAHSPRSGLARPELGETIRSVPFGQYVVFYSLNDAELRIERVLHGARDMGTAYGVTP